MVIAIGTDNGQVVRLRTGRRPGHCRHLSRYGFKVTSTWAAPHRTDPRITIVESFSVGIIVRLP